MMRRYLHQPQSNRFYSVGILRLRLTARPESATNSSALYSSRYLAEKIMHAELFSTLFSIMLELTILRKKAPTENWARKSAVSAAADWRPGACSQ